MAIKVQKTREEFQQKLYSGIAAVNVITLNPTKEERNKIFNISSNKEPEYLGNAQVKNNYGEMVEVPKIRLNFVCKTDPMGKCNSGIDAFFNVNITLRKAYKYSNKDGINKIQVIDIYGRTAWVTEQEMQNHSIPMYSNGPANISTDYRPCYQGEEDLYNFLIAYCGIPSPIEKVGDKYVTKTDLSKLMESEVRFEEKTILAMFNNDLTELKDIVKQAIDLHNTVKICLGVSEYNSQWNQIVLNKYILNSTSSYSKIQEYILKEQEQGRLKDQIYEVGDLHEYVINNNIYANQPANNTTGGDTSKLPGFHF